MSSQHKPSSLWGFNFSSHYHSHVVLTSPPLHGIDSIFFPIISWWTFSSTALSIHVSYCSYKATESDSEGRASYPWTTFASRYIFTNYTTLFSWVLQCSHFTIFSTPIVSASPGNSLAMQILRPHSDLLNQSVGGAQQSVH